MMNQEDEGGNSSWRGEGQVGQRKGAVNGSFDPFDKLRAGLLRIGFGNGWRID
jgi:hypothetical protein